MFQEIDCFHNVLIDSPMEKPLFRWKRHISRKVQIPVLIFEFSYMLYLYCLHTIDSTLHGFIVYDFFTPHSTMHSICE